MNTARFFRCLATASSLAMAVAGAHAAGEFPDKPITLIVPFAAAGGTDAVARVVARALSKRLGQEVIVDNRPGAGGTIGTLAVARSQPDGYTLLLGSNGTMVLNPLLYPALQYNVDKDLAPVSGIGTVAYLLVTNPTLPANDVSQLMKLAAGKPNEVSFASPGNGTTNHLVGVLLGSQGKVALNHIPYRGASPAMNDVISGQVTFMSGDFGTLMPMVKAGKLKALGVTGTSRVPILPNVPAIAESLPGFDAQGWFGIFAPKRTPAAAVQKIAVAMGGVLTDPDVLQRLNDIGGTPMKANGDQLHRLIEKESVRWRKIIKDNKVTADTLN